MGIRGFKPTSPAIRHMTVSTFEEITKKKPEKALVVALKKNAGRNNRGVITVRHRGGGAKESTESSISREIKMVFLQQYLRLSMIQIEQLTLHF